MKGADLKGLAATVERAIAVGMETLDRHRDEAIERLQDDADGVRKVIEDLRSGLSALERFAESRNPLAGILPTSEAVITGEVEFQKDTQIINGNLRTSQFVDDSRCYFDAGWGNERKMAVSVKAGKYSVVTILVRKG